MNIAIIDECNGKFMGDIREHWGREGHTIRFDKYFDPKLVHWADVTFFDWAGNNVQRASHSDDSFWTVDPQPKNKIICLRAHDIDIWVGQHRNVDYSWINHLIFIAPHLMEKALSEIQIPENVKVHFIPHGINTKKFTFRKKERGKKIAFIGNICDQKKMENTLLILAELPRDYSLHVLGEHLGSWRKAYVDYFIRHNNLNVIFTERVESVNDFLEDKDFLISCSIKEGFGYVMGEAMAKGIKTLIHNFWGADQVWDGYPYIWNTISEAVKMILEDKYEPEIYRDYIIKNYPLDKMLKAYDELLKN